MVLTVSVICCLLVLAQTIRERFFHYLCKMRWKVGCGGRVSTAMSAIFSTRVGVIKVRERSFLRCGYSSLIILPLPFNDNNNNKEDF